MICHICGSKLEKIITDLPLKISNEKIVIIRKLPVLQCGNCQEYLIEDEIMEQVEIILRKSPSEAEIEIMKFAV